MENLRIGFLTLQELETPDTFVGALLITNEFGIPLEFKCSHAIKPSAIQKTLYGDKLKTHIAVGLCGLPLIEASANKPEFICTNQSFILDLRNSTEIPTLFIARTGDVINLGSDEKRDIQKMRVESTDGVFQPIVFQSHPLFGRDSEKLMPTMTSLFQRFDLLEPFDRMTKSIEILGKNDAKFA
jgi:hypothetical protein